MGKLKLVPKHFLCLPMEVYSNIDREINRGVAEDLEKGGTWAIHIARHFVGQVFCESGTWFEVIKMRRGYVTTLESKDLHDLLASANLRFGAE